MRLNSSSQTTPVLVFVGILKAIPSGLLFQSLSWVMWSCGIPFSLRLSAVWVRGRLTSVSLPVFQSVCSTHWWKTAGNSWSSSFHTVRKHFSLLIHTKRHLEGARRESSPCMSLQHRWCVIVWSSERGSQVWWMWPSVWIGRTPSVVNLPCDFHSALQRSHLSDSLLLVILFRQKFDGKQCMIDSSILLWSWCRTCVFFSHSPSLSRLSLSVKSQSPVKVDVIAPLLCNKNVLSSVVCSRFLDVWHSHKKVGRSIHNSGSSSSICPSSVKSFPFSHFLSNIITHSIDPYRSLENCRSPVFCEGDWSFIYRSVRRVVPNRFLVFFETA
jgi:hypothetical protein